MGTLGLVVRIGVSDLLVVSRRGGGRGWGMDVCSCSNLDPPLLRTPTSRASNKLYYYLIEFEKPDQNYGAQ